MIQLLSHLLILICLYRSVKMFFWEWSGVNIFMLGWILSLFALVGLLSSHFWLFLTAPLSYAHQVGWLIGWLYSYWFWHGFCLLLIILFVDRTEWYWGHFCWTGREIFIRTWKNKTFKWTLPVIIDNWIGQQIDIANNNKWRSHLEWTKWVKYSLLFFFSCFVINYFDFPMFHLCWSNVWYFIHFSPQDIIWLYTLIYFIVCLIKWYLVIVYPFANTGYKHIGIAHRKRYIFMPSSEWLRNDILVLQPSILFKTILAEYKYMYEIPPYWITWQQTVIDIHEPTWVKLRMLNWLDCKYWLYTHKKLIIYKYSRFEEFSFELGYLNLNEEVRNKG